MQLRPNSPFVSIVGLGPLKSEHPSRRAGQWVELVFGGVCLLAAPALGLLAIFVGLDAYNRHGLRTVDDVVILPLALAGIALVLGLFLVYSAWRHWGLAAALYEHGFAFNDRTGVKQVRWDQIDSVWQAVTKHYTNGVYTGTTHVYTVRAEDGAKIVLNDRLAKVEELGQTIQAGTARALWPKYVAALQNGRRVEFGPLAIDAQGLYAGKKSLRWDEIKAIKIDRGMISVKKEGGWLSWASATVPQIPNFYIFYELIGKFAKVE